MNSKQLVERAKNKVRAKTIVLAGSEIEPCLGSPCGGGGNVCDNCDKAEEIREARDTLALEKIKAIGYVIEYNPPPIPMRNCDWQYAHQDYDGPEDHRCGCGPDPETCLDWIMDYEAEHCPSDEVAKIIADGRKEQGDRIRDQMLRCTDVSKLRDLENRFKRVREAEAEMVEWIGIKNEELSFEEIVEQIKSLPLTMIPAVMTEAAKAGYEKNCFVDGGASTLVHRIENEIGRHRKEKNCS